MKRLINGLLVVLCLFLASIAVAGPSILSIYQGGTGASTGAQALINLIGGSPATGNALTWNGSAWVPSNTVGGGGPNIGCQSNCSYILASPDMNFLNAASNGASALSFSLATANRAEFIRIFNTTARTLGNATVDVLTASAGGHADVGVYSISGTTGTLQWHTGSFSTTTANTALSFTPTPYTMGAGSDYYVAWCADNTSAQLAALAASNGGVSATILSAGAIHTFGVNATDTCTAGVLPNSITTTNITNTSVQMVMPYVSISN
jgi:hypothetical protein